MKKCLFFCVLLLMAAWVSAQPRTKGSQKTSVVNLIRSSQTTGVKRNGADVLKVYKGTFQQDYSRLSADSSYFYPQNNSFDAFGHVIINQGDTLNIYADKLNYNGNTHTAILTDNVRMVDKDATLTTNYLTYNTATRVGTYTGGGKLVNKQNTLVSKNGYYYAFTRDAYFRYNVVLTTIDALIKTDTLRYNSGSRIAYFYGPTRIYGSKNKDTLYTENGTYNTITEQAFFGKRNLYSQGTKTLKGDSLFYDRLKGYGRAIRNITFNDNEQKITLKGNLGTYFNADERTVVTNNAYVILVTEQQDSAKNDSIAPKPAPTDKTKKTKLAGKQPDVALSPATAADLADKAKSQAGKLKAISKDTVLTEADKIIGKDQAAKAGNITGQGKIPDKDTLLAGAGKLNTAGNVARAKAIISNQPDKSKTSGKKATAGSAETKAAPRTKLDSVYIAADTLETQVITYQLEKLRREKSRPNKARDSLAKAHKLPVYTQSTAKHLYLPPSAGILRDTNLFQPRFFGRPKIAAADTSQKKKPAAKKPVLSRQKKTSGTDSVYMTTRINLSDTARVRVLTAHHHSQLFKSDLQAKADSMFYSTSDSIIRCYVHPLMWTQGSQLSGDTIYLQMKNRKLNNMEQFPNAFVVNIEDNDSTHFNQVAGKKMRGFFVDNKMSRMFVDGNAESIYFARDSGKVSNMMRSLSSRIRVNFKKNEVTDITQLTKPEYRYGPLSKFTEEDKTLKGFLWKPKERPVSKEAVITAYSRRQAAARLAGRQPVKAPPGKKLPAAIKPGSAAQAGVKVAAADSVSRLPAGNPGRSKVKVSADSMKAVVSAPLKLLPGKDSSATKQRPVKQPAQKPAVKDTVRK